MTNSQIEVSNIRFGTLEDNIRTPSQNIAFLITIKTTERDLTLSLLRS